MPTAHVNGMDVEFETAGDPSDPPMLLVIGLGAQLITWPQGFVDALVGRGFFIIRYDNRDSGLSTKCEGIVDLFALLGAPDAAPVPYRIEDMAEDGVALLDHLGIDQVHLVGASMGGMIAQAMVIAHPARFWSVCSIMSTTGDRAVGAPTGEALTALIRPAASSRAEAVAASVAASRVIGSPGYPFDEALQLRRAEAAYDRCYFPAGTARQLGAILSATDRTPGLGAVRQPFLVIHGEEDPLVTVSGGTATAAAVPGSSLLLMPGMGHDLPEQTWDTIVDAIVRNTELATV